MDVKFPLLVVGCAERHVQLGDYMSIMSQSDGFSVRRSIQENYRELTSHTQGYIMLYIFIYEFIVAICRHSYLDYSNHI